MVPKYKKIIYYFILLVTFIYILFRIFFTMPYTFNFSFVFFGIIVLVIEIFDFCSFAIHVLHVLTKDYLPPKAPSVSKKDYPELDIFIASINEDIELVEGTINACKNMKYPDKKKLHFYLCDDGHREEMKKLCRKTHIHYIDREDHKDAKAGNYNHALSVTHSPYIVVFDADMRPTADYLMKTVPYLFLSDHVGFVQTPQNFRNYDLFQQRFKLNHIIPLEQEYFYHRIQISKNHNNSCIYCGTNAILSRRALEEIGGFATKSVTEDIATGLLLQRHGYQGISLPYDEAFGLNVEDYSSLLKQKTRWCRGCLQTFKNYRILMKSNLSFAQKMDYLSNVHYWLFGLRNLIYLSIPILYTFFDIRIVFRNINLFLIFFAIQYFLKRFVIDFLEGRKVSSTWNRIYEIILSPAILIDSIKTLIGYNDFIVDVAKKKKSNDKIFKYYFTIFFHIFFFILSLIAIYYSFDRIYYLNVYTDIVPVFWLVTNCVFLLFALIFDFSNKVSLDDKREKVIQKYPLYSSILLVFKFVFKELKLKGIVIGCLIALFIRIMIPIYQFYQYQKDVIIKDDAFVSYNGWLSVLDGGIVNNKGNRIQLRGVSSHNLKFWGDYYTKDHLKELVDTWGMNVFRIAVFTDPIQYGYIEDRSILKKVEKIIDICIDLDIYVVVDWHILEDNNPNTYKEESKEFFNYLSLKYQNNPNVIYEICNEPNGEDITWDEFVKPYAEELTSVIRKNSPDSLIVVGLPSWSKDIKSAEDNLLEDKNTVYAVHYYVGHYSYDKLKDDMVEAKRVNMPFFVTECGPTNATGNGEIGKREFSDWIDFLNENKIGWIVWQLSDKDESSSLILPKYQKDQSDFFTGKKTLLEIRKTPYRVNDYLSDTGLFIKNIFLRSN